jgi:hypothetical protein
MAVTGQPYAYTADDPLNSTDPLGLARKQKRLQPKQLSEAEKEALKGAAAGAAIDERVLNAAKKKQQFNEKHGYTPDGTGLLPTPTRGSSGGSTATRSPGGAQNRAVPLGQGAGGPQTVLQGPPSTEQYFSGSGYTFRPTPTEIAGGSVVVLGVIAVFLLPIGA